MTNSGSKEVEPFLDAEDSLLIKLGITAFLARHSAITPVAYVKEAAPETTRDTNLFNLIGIAAALMTGVSPWERIRKIHPFLNDVFP